jgi:hypothetical protein
LKGSGLDLIVVLFSIFLKGLREIRTSNRIAGELAEFRTKDLPNTSLHRYP